jgi:Tol biopolymer transport system component
MYPTRSHLSVLPALAALIAAPACGTAAVSPDPPHATAADAHSTPAAHAHSARTDVLAVSRIGCRPCYVGISLVNASGGHGTALTRHTGWEDNSPAWSPDARWIAFSRTTDGYRSYHLYVMRSDGRGVHQITHGRFDEQPAWSPDGRWIAYQSTDGIALVRPDGRGRHIVRGMSDAAFPAWSPTSRQLTFSQSGYIWTARTDGSARHRLVRGDDPSWSPTGRTIAYMPPDGGVATVPAAGGRARWLGNGMEPSFSPSGNQIVFTRWPATNQFNVWTMNADGSGRRLVMRDARTPAWRP